MLTVAGAAVAGVAEAEVVVVVAAVVVVVDDASVVTVPAPVSRPTEYATDTSRTRRSHTAPGSG